MTDTQENEQNILVPLDEIKERSHLVRTITAQSVENMKQILKRYGQVQAILVNKEHRIIDGHVRFRAAKSLKWSKIKVSILDLPSAMEEQLVLALANIGPETSQWNEDRLLEELHHLKNFGAMPSAVPAAIKKQLKEDVEKTKVQPTKFKLTVICESEDEQRDAFEFANKRQWNPRISGIKR